MLNKVLPSAIQRREQDGLSGDMDTYNRLQVKSCAGCNIVLGDLLYKFVGQGYSELPKIKGEDRVKKITFADVAHTLSEKILELIEDHSTQNVVIEIGGTVGDLEQNYIPMALQSLGIKTGIVPRIIILSHLDYTEEQKDKPADRLKTQPIRYGIRNVISLYQGLPIEAVVIRRRHVPPVISNKDCQREIPRIAHELPIEEKKLFFLDNVGSPEQLKKALQEAHMFEDEKPSIWISACLFGASCRYDGRSKPMASYRINTLLSDGALVVNCPELIAGFTIPRGPFEIVGGDGDDVLDGKAIVYDKEGNDVTLKFIKGAIKTLEFAKQAGVRVAIMKSKSPSCSPNTLEGSDGQQRDGVGVTAALFRRWGISTITPEEYFAQFL